MAAGQVGLTPLHVLKSDFVVGYTTKRSSEHVPIQLQAKEARNVRESPWEMWLVLIWEHAKVQLSSVTYICSLEALDTFLNIFVFLDFGSWTSWTDSSPCPEITDCREYNKTQNRTCIHSILGNDENNCVGQTSRNVTCYDLRECLGAVFECDIYFLFIIF